jgi:hypothetical protein
MKLHKLLVLLVAAAASGQASIIYNFTGTGLPSETVGFELIVSSFVNPAVDGPITAFGCIQLAASTNCQSGNPDAIIFSNQSVLGNFSAQLEFFASNNTSYNFDFPSGAFGALGVYNSQSGSGLNIGTLSVSQTPEPGTMVLFLSAVCLGFFGLRKSVKVVRVSGSTLT